MKHRYKSLAAGLAVITALSAVAPSVGAQSNQQIANGYRISPVRSELTIEKGKSETISITVENPTDIATVAHPVVNDFIASTNESGSAQLILDENAPAPRNSFKKLVGPLANVTLGPREKKDVQVKLTVPATSNAGGFYGAVRFVPSNQVQPGGNTNVGLTASVGTIVLVTVPGDLKQRLDMVQLSASQHGKAKKFITSGDVTILTRLKNSGDIHVKPFGRIELKNTFGKTIGSYEFNNTEPKANILPDSIRKFENKVDQKKLFGRYTIQASLAYEQGSGDLVLSKTTFWYVPTWVVYTLLLVILIIALAIWWLIRRSQGKKALLKVRLRRKKRH